METEVKLAFKDRESLLYAASSEWFASHCRDLEGRSLTLQNHYLDTLDHKLGSRGVSLRKRHYLSDAADSYEFTVKYKGEVESGLHKHFEWNLKNRTVLPISLRPKYVEKRNELGHLEIDSIVGKKNEQASIISIVDRCSRMLWLIKSEYKNEYYTDKLIYEFILENRITVKSITVDNGLEFKALGLCAKRLGVKLYKCDPYCSFQRGTNERTNALVRRWIPKGTSMKNVPQIWLDDICFQINTMPRKIFDYSTPIGIDLNYQ